MINTPNLGLKVWNLTTDPYDSGQLADNWARVDEHDHAAGRGKQIPTGGIEDGAVTANKLAVGANVPPDSSITSAKLASESVTSSKLAIGATSATYVTSLPGSPVDGQEVYYAADATSGVIWHLRYRSAASTHKWEFVGGSPIHANRPATTGASRNSATYGDLSDSALPSISLALAGDYLVTFGCTLFRSTTTSAVSFVTANVTTPANDDQAAVLYAPSSDVNTAVSKTFVLSNVSAASTLKLYFRASAGSVGADRRHITVNPIRVSA